VNIPDRLSVSPQEFPKLRFPEPIFPSDFFTMKENLSREPLGIERAFPPLCVEFQESERYSLYSESSTPS
jgi:hypothetical protein